MLVISLFLALAIEPGVNRLARRGWRRGRATAAILLGVLVALLVFVAAIGTLVGTQVADLLSNSETYITDTVDFINDTFDTEIDAAGRDRRVQRPERRASSGSSTASRTTPCVCPLPRSAVLLQVFSVLLFTYYLVADGPRLRRVDLQPPAPGAPGTGALGVGAGDHQDRRLPLLAGAAGDAVGVLPLDRVPGGGHPGARSRSRSGSAWSASSCPWSARTSPASCRC